jgi:hypothetical protein
VWTGEDGLFNDHNAARSLVHSITTGSFRIRRASAIVTAPNQQLVLASWVEKTKTSCLLLVILTFVPALSSVRTRPLE